MENIKSPNLSKTLNKKEIEELIAKYKKEGHDLEYDGAHIIVNKKGGKIFFPARTEGDIMENGKIVGKIPIKEAIKMALDKEGTEYDKE
jgi:hypothetical protein